MNKRNLFFIVALLITACLFVCCKRSTIEIYDLRCENLENPLSIDNLSPHLSWKTKFNENGDKQFAYQILVATDNALLNDQSADLWNTGKTVSPQSVMIPYAGKDLSGLNIVYWKVCIWDNEGNTVWSKTSRFGLGLTDSKIRTAKYIGLPKESGNPQSPLLRKQFDLQKKEGSQFLYINSLGYHEAYLNGKKIGDQVLAPAVTQQDKRTLYLTYDVTEYLKKGKNDLVIWLGQGWYRPRIPGVVYEGPLVKAWLETEQPGSWSSLLVSDDGWLAAESGYSGIGTWQWQQFGGELIDAVKTPGDLTSESLNRLEWFPVSVIDVPEHAVSPQMCENNLITETIKPVAVHRLSDTVWIADMGKALTGWAEIKFSGLKKGQTITLEYSDRFDEKAGFENQNQKDMYIASGNGNEVFCNKFNYHGFQYVKISNLTAPLTLDQVTGYLIRTGFGGESTFQCSDEDLNAIHQMIQYTIQCLSLSGYIVDCPHLERLGYGGDGNAATYPAQTMYNLSPLYANWLQAWADCIQEDGRMPYAAPNPYWQGGGPYYSGFIITASWNAFVNYGDARFIERYYPVMQQWLMFVENYFVDGYLRPWPERWYLGDWAGPEGIDKVNAWASPEGIDQRNPLSIDVVCNSYICVCYETIEKMARYLGKAEDAALYAIKKEQLRKTVHDTFFDNEKNIYALGVQVDLAYPMLAQITPEHLIPKVTESLLKETFQNRGGHWSCGIVGVAVLTEWAIKNNQQELIYALLKKRSYPSYLYMIDNGATTTWEHWEGYRSRIHNCYNGIGTWFYQAIGGVRPDEKEPGYRKIRIEPQIPKGITWAKTSIETPYGTLSVNWKLDGQIMKMDLVIPSGSTAYVTLPDDTQSYTLNQKNHSKSVDGEVMIESGEYQVTYSLNN